MARPEQYHQPALSLDQAEPSPPLSAGINHRDEAPAMLSITYDPEGLPRGLASHRMPNDFWPEFHLEWELREQHGMAPVSPAEFADMRDCADGVTVSLAIGVPAHLPYPRLPFRQARIVIQVGEDRVGIAGDHRRHTEDPHADPPAAPGGGMRPTCCSRLNRSLTSHDSTIFPSAMRWWTI